MIHYKCPSCGTSGECGDFLAGLAIHCKKCYQSVQLPARSTAISTMPVPRVVQKETEDHNNRHISDPSAHCALCGSGGPLQQFILRTFSATSDFGTVTRRWCDFPSECCSPCFQRLSRLQSANLLLTIISTVTIILSPMLWYILQSISIILGLVALLSGAGLVIVWISRRNLVSSPYVISLIEQLKAEHQCATGDSRIKVIPLATTSKSIYL
jgi:hypothetical protein